jgi:hypothetical protein
MFPDAQWTPLSLADVHIIFDDAPFQWALGGGYAVEQFLGAPIRAHDDVDIAIFRDEQLAAQSHLAGWELFAADPPGTLRRWTPGEYLPFGIHDIWGHRPGAQGWEFQFLVAEVEGGEWFSRRDPRIRGQRADLMANYNGFPCVRIEVQLMYKAKGLRPKDELDFAACLPRLSDESKAWLNRTLRIVYPDGHPWLDALSS